MPPTFRKALKIHEWDSGRAVLRADGEPALLEARSTRRSSTKSSWNLAAAALVVWADRRPGSATAGPSRCMSRPAAGRLWIELYAPSQPRPSSACGSTSSSIIVGLLAVAYLFWQRGRPPEVITRGADHAGRDAAAVPAGPTRNPVRRAPVTMVTGDPPRLTRSRRPDSDGNRRDPADAQEPGFAWVGPVLRLCTLRYRPAGDPGRVRPPSEPSQRRPADDSPVGHHRGAPAPRAGGRDVRSPAAGSPQCRLLSPC